MRRRFPIKAGLLILAVVGLFLSGFVVLNVWGQTSVRSSKSATASASQRCVVEGKQTPTRAVSPETLVFLPAVNYNSQGVNPRVVAAADLNGDGKVDAVIANDAAVAVFLGKGDGKFNKAVSYPINGPGIAIVVADVNGDHKPDLLITTYADSAVSVLLGNGNGTFQAPVGYDSGGTAPWSLATADLNKDGKLDIVVANRNSGTIGVLLGNGNGTFQPTLIFAISGTSPDAVGIADFNGDGNLDLAVGDEFPLSAGIFLGKGDGTFEPGSTMLGNTASVAIADLNGDHKPDVVGAGPNSADIWLGNGDGNFAAPYGNPVNWPTAVAVADVNSDGKPDLVLSSYANGSHGAANVLLGNGDGTFQSVISFSAARFGTNGIAVADLDGNGKPDFLVANGCTTRIRCNGNNGFLGVLLNNTGSATTTIVSTSGSPSVLHQPVTFTASVTASTGSVPDGDLVRFYDGSMIIATVPLTAGTAEFTTSKLKAKTHTIKATYIGDLTLQISSATLLQVVQ